MLTKDVLDYANRSILCWLATSSLDHVPNVSPKEIFTTFGEPASSENPSRSHILIANIASPQTVRNIKSNPKVCISFIDVLVQKGYQLKGTAELVYKKDPRFEELAAPLLEITQGHYPFASITFVKIEKVKPILAPSYLLFPKRTVEERVASARKAYGV